MSAATHESQVEAFIEQWRHTGGSELANTQSFINGLCQLIGVDPPAGSRADDVHNDYVFERRVFQNNGDDTQSFGRIDCYKRNCFVLEAKQGSDADRQAEARGEDDLDLFGQTASARLKRGTARRGTPNWARAMVQAKGQAERYAKALPADHGWPPFLLLADIGYCIELYADFSGTGKAYAQFPDRARYRIMLEDLRHLEVRERLRAVWIDPKSLDPAVQGARVTREIADLLATLSRRLEARGHNADAVSSFLMRILFTMFAEDTAVLLPKDSFKKLLREHESHPEHLHHSLSALWKAMDKGEFAPALRQPVKRFNGYLFKNTEALALDREELRVLIEAASKDWREVEPAIFGTLLERALNPKERAKLGAHYTPRAYVERLIGPTIMDPLRAEWVGVRGAAAVLIEDGKSADAHKLVEAFHGKIASTKVLDPACGTGNFLYVAMARMKELEGEVLDLLAELGDAQYLHDLSGVTVTPENFLGIEINPRAAAIAQLVLWIGYLQWHFRVNGRDRSPPEPILEDIRTIENRDALIDYDERVVARDEDGNVLTRWDGETTKDHPVTGLKVPDEDARVEVFRYVNPRSSKWPKADYIVGNPPFIGNKRMKERLGAEYVEAVRSAYPSVSAAVDFVMYWWAISASQKRCIRFGFITTNSISQAFNRVIIEEARAVKLTYAIPNHPWVDGTDGADVRIAMTVASPRGRATNAVLESVIRETPIPNGYGEREVLTAVQTGESISSNLTLGTNVHSATPLRANRGLACPGVQLSGQGFVLSSEQRAKFPLASREIIPRYLTGWELNNRPKLRYVIDTFGLSEAELKARHPEVYQHLYSYVRPERLQNPRAKYAREWWLHAEPRAKFRRSFLGLSRMCVTSRTSKHRVFEFCPMSVLPETKVLIVALDDAFHLGVLNSKHHVLFSTRAGGRLGVGNDPTYNHSDCFDPFPFPEDVPNTVMARIRDAAEELDALRKQVLQRHEDLTLTKLYNVLEALHECRPLTDGERDVHERGLVTLIAQLHDQIDAGVAEAYGWPADLPDDDVLTQLVALNRERASKEASGQIRWLRPNCQAPRHEQPIGQTLDLAEAEPVLPDNVIPWPAQLPEQVSAVQEILAGSPAPLAPQDVARAFKGKRAASVRPVLDALANIGMARRLSDGRYAA